MTTYKVAKEILSFNPEDDESWPMAMMSEIEFDKYSLANSQAMAAAYLKLFKLDR